MRRFDEVITAIDITIVFDGQRLTALPSKNAQRGFQSGPHRECFIEELNKDFADILLQPFVKNRNQEFAELMWQDAATAHRFPGIVH